MKVFLAILLIAGIVSCDNASDLKKEADTLTKQLDTTVDKALNSELADSIRSKGGKIVDEVKTKGGELWDTTKSKGGKLLDKGEKEWNKLTKKDSGKTK